MGSAVVKAVHDHKELQLVGAVDAESIDADVGEIAGIGKVGVKINSSIDDLQDTDVIVDFTNPEVVENNVLEALEKGYALCQRLSKSSFQAIRYITFFEKIIKLFESNSKIEVSRHRSY